MALREEILDQPEALRQLLAREAPRVAAVAAAVCARSCPFALVAARGSSDHAGLFAKYLWGAANRLPVALAAPSLFTLYGQPPALGDALVVGFSQSGHSPDIVSVLSEARRQGALTVAITNAPGSPLAAEAEHVIALGVGSEQAVAATKSYTAELLATAMLSAAMSGDSADWRALSEVPAAVAAALATEEAVARAADRYAAMQRCFVLARGFNYATAFELALKLKELCYVGAEPYSSADFQHGPIAVVEPGFPILAVAPQGLALPHLEALLLRLGQDKAAELIVISDQESTLRLARTPLRLDHPLPEWLSPIASIVPGQLFAYHLARAKGCDAERPRGLNKVTETW
jgi:glucosamine--fructose-6-phosphate aminotransferase (isomerizing)